MIPFDVGTWVRIVDNGYSSAFKGRVGVVTGGPILGAEHTRMVASDPTLEEHTSNYKYGGNDFHYAFTIDELEEIK